MKFSESTDKMRFESIESRFTEVRYFGGRAAIGVREEDANGVLSTAGVLAGFELLPNSFDHKPFNDMESPRYSSSVLKYGRANDEKKRDQWRSLRLSLRREIIDALRSSGDLEGVYCEVPHGPHRPWHWNAVLRSLRREFKSEFLGRRDRHGREDGWASISRSSWACLARQAACKSHAWRSRFRRNLV